MCELNVPPNVIVSVIALPNVTLPSIVVLPVTPKVPPTVVLPVTPKVPPNVALPDISATPLISNEPPSTSPDAVKFTAPVNEPAVSDATESDRIGA